MAYPLTLTFRKSILEKKIPSAWRLANICPIFKKGSRTERGNYRPISLTSIVCNVLEGILRDELMAFFLSTYNKYLYELSRQIDSANVFLKNYYRRNKSSML